ncbi:MAG TPA: ester cyclase [Gemmatimonas sp.]|nr:ester cyclase [Gemmatimonas sp.]
MPVLPNDLDANKDIVRQFFDAVSNADYAALDRLVADDYDDHRTGQRGRPALIGYFQDSHRALSGMRIIIDSIVAEGDRVMVRNRIVGVHQGEMMGIAPSGRAIDVAAMQEYRVEAGRLAAHWEVADALTLLQQVGATGLPESASG